MKIAHTYCLNNNIGDYALGIGVKNIFRRFFNISFFADYNLQGQIFDDYFINIINTKYDLLIIGGGGIIHGAHWPQGWFWLIERENIKKIKIPFIIYGAGYNYFKDEEGIPTRGVEHLKETSERAAFFSVRNDGSYQRLLDQTNIKAEVVADPGFWIPLDFSESFSIKEKYIVVQLANDKPEHRFGSLKYRDYFIKIMKSVLNKTSEKYKIVFAPHVYEDIELSHEIASVIKNSSVIDFGKYAFDKSNKFIGIYKNAEFVLAMRGHGQIIPLGFEVPVISLENHAKHAGLMKDYNLHNYNVDITNKNFGISLEVLIENLQKNKNEIKETIKNRNMLLLEETENKIKNIKVLSKFLR